MLVYRLRLRPNIDPKPYQCLVFAFIQRGQLTVQSQVNLNPTSNEEKYLYFSKK